MRQDWSSLLFLHWEAQEADLAALLPEGLVVDTFEGRAYVGIVLFTMSGIRYRCMPPIPGHTAFHETNLRTYVRHKGTPGVWFFSLEAANRTAVRVARRRYGLPYHFSRMTVDAQPDSVTYRCERLWPEPLPGCVEASSSLGEPLGHALAGSLDHFLIERYRLFALRGGTLRSLEVRHSPYPLREVRRVSVNESLSAAGGLRLSGEPLAHFSDGVSTHILPMRQV